MEAKMVTGKVKMAWPMVGTRPGSYSEYHTRTHINPQPDRLDSITTEIESGVRKLRRTKMYSFNAHHSSKQYALLFPRMQINTLQFY